MADAMDGVIIVLTSVVALRFAWDHLICPIITNIVALRVGIHAQLNGHSEDEDDSSYMVGFQTPQPDDDGDQECR